MARELKKCMMALPIILDTKQYTEYLAIRNEPNNIINNAELIETLRQNASLLVEPQTRVITTIGTEIPCGGPFQPIYRNLNGRWIATSPTLQIATTPVDVVELMKEWEEGKPADDRKLDFMYGGVYDDVVVRETSNDGRCNLFVPPVHSQWSWCHGAGPPLHRVRGHRVDVLGPMGGLR
jgi:hypothetical protein